MRERERERERGGGDMRESNVNFLQSVNLNVRKATIIIIIIMTIIIIIIMTNPLCRFCNTRERQRGNNAVVKDTSSVAGKLPLYPL